MGAHIKCPQDKHTRGCLQTTTEYYLIRPTSGTPKEWSQQAHEPTEATLTLWRQPTYGSSGSVSMASSHNQSLWDSIPPIDLSTATKVKLKQEGTHISHKYLSWRTHFRWPGRLCYWDTKGTYYIKLSCQDLKMLQICLIHKNKQKNSSQNEETKKHAPQKRSKLQKKK